ncbi:MAG: hypothetical protein ACYCV7_10295, partial [Acidimicrobiales bacterium]
VKATSNSKGAAGQYVKLSVPSSGASATVVTTNPAPTGPNGIAVFALRANNTPGTFTVTATWQGLTKSFTLTNGSTSGTPLVNPALTVVSGNGQSAPVGDLFSLALTVKATSNSKGAAGQYVKLSVPSSGASATVVTTNPAPTGPNGIAVFALRANNTPGTFTVTVTWQGLTKSFTLTNG